MNYVSKENMADILDGIARKIGQGGSGDSSGVVAKQKVLYEGTELITDMTLNTIYQISDITGYDFLILTIEAPIIQSYEDKSVRYIQTEIIKNPMVDGTLKYRYDFTYNSQGFATVAASFGGNYSFTDSTHIRFAPRNYGSDYEGVCLKKIEGIKFVSSSSSTSEINYSTEEQQIGTWIDGKPLYQKTYSFISPSAVNTIKELGSIPEDADYSTIVYVDSVLQTTNGYVYPMQHYLGSSDFFDVFIRPNRNICVEVGSSNQINSPFIVTLRYTKLDQAPSSEDMVMVLMPGHTGSTTTVSSDGLASTNVDNGIVRTSRTINRNSFYFEYRVTERGGSGHPYIGIFPSNASVFTGGEASNNVAPSYNFGANNYRGWTFQVIESYISSGDFNILGSVGNNPDDNYNWVGVGIIDDGTNMIIKQYSSSGELLLTTTINNSKFRLRNSYLYTQTLYEGGGSGSFTYNFGAEGFKFTELAEQYYT